MSTNWLIGNKNPWSWLFRTNFAKWIHNKKSTWVYSFMPSRGPISCRNLMGGLKFINSIKSYFDNNVVISFSNNTSSSGNSLLCNVMMYINMLWNYYDYFLFIPIVVACVTLCFTFCLDLLNIVRTFIRMKDKLHYL